MQYDQTMYKSEFINIKIKTKLLQFFTILKKKQYTIVKNFESQLT